MELKPASEKFKRNFFEDAQKEIMSRCKDKNNKEEVKEQIKIWNREQKELIQRLLGNKKMKVKDHQKLIRCSQFLWSIHMFVCLNL